ncbi:protein of unknown function [Ruminococcaceae bacterium BL-4]|nr:protein of unknown function [Ruminococcaceae bacterium BL-4]
MFSNFTIILRVFALKQGIKKPHQNANKWLSDAVFVWWAI